MKAFALILCFIFPGILFAQDSAEILKRVSAALEPQIKSGKVVGGIFGVSLNGVKTLLPFGSTKRGENLTPNENTMFEIGSITKTFTTLLLADLVTKKVVSLTDPLSLFIPEISGQKTGEITLQELATHTSGLPKIPCDLNSPEPMNPYAHYSEANLIQGLMDATFASIKDCELKSHPTKSIDYSNWGMSILGYALSRKMNKPYPEMVRETITTPLGMSDTVVELSSEQSQRMAQGYFADGFEAPLWDRLILYGQGALRSDAHDFFLYGDLQLHPESNALGEAVSLSHQLRVPGTSISRIGLGWFITRGNNIYHNGRTGGFTSTMKIYPKDNLYFFILVNSGAEAECIVEAVDNIPCTKTLKD